MAIATVIDDAQDDTAAQWPLRPPESHDEDNHLSVDAAVRSSQNLLSALSKLGSADPKVSFEVAWDAEEDSPPPPPSPPPVASRRMEVGSADAAEVENQRAKLEAEIANRRQQKVNGQRCSVRLYEDAAERRELRCLQKVAIEEGVVANCSFIPTINASSERLVAAAVGNYRRPLHARVAELEKAAALRREALECRVEKERREQAPFRPEIDERSRKLRSDNRSASARLAADAWRRALAEKDRAAAATAAADAKRRLDGSFRAAKQTKEKCRFEERERRRQLDKIIKEREREAKQKQEEEQLFRPTTTKRAAKVSSRGVESLSKDRERSIAKREAIKQAELDQIPFAPTLVARQLPAARRRQSTRRRSAHAEEQFSFQPKILHKPNAASRVFEDPDKRRAEIEERRRRAIRDRELNELKECSFQPTIRRRSRSKYPQPATAAVEPVVIRGLARHLELKARADKLNQDKRDRERAAFNVDKAVGWRNGQNFTTPIPFDLSSSTRLSNSAGDRQPHFRPSLEDTTPSPRRPQSAY